MRLNNKVLTIAALSSSVFISGVVHAVPLDVPGGGAACFGTTCPAEGVDFSGDGTLTVADGTDIGATNGVSASNSVGMANKGSIDFVGDSTVAGSIGPVNGINAIDLQGAAKTVVLNGDVNATKIDFSGNGTLQVNDGANITAPITATNAGDGSVNFKGSSNVMGALGTGNLNTIVQDGTGTVVLNNAVNTKSDITINGGTLRHLDDITTATKVDVTAAGTLETAASKTLTGALNNAGTVSTGANTLTVTGAYTQAAGSNLNVDATAGGAGSVDASAAGAAVDAGSTINVAINGVIPNGTVIADVIKSNAPVIVPMVSGGTATYSLALAQNANNLDLTVTRTPLAATTSGTEQLGGIAAALDGASTVAGSHLLPLINLVEAQPNLAGVEDVLNTVAPTSDGSLMIVSQNNVAQGLATAGHRMEHLRLVMNNPGYAAGDGALDAASWVQFFGTSFDQDSRNSVAGFDGWNAGFALGTDMHLMPNVLVGAGFSYAYSDVESKFRTSNEMNIHTYQGFLYGTWEPMDDWYMDAMLSLAFHDYNTKRNIVIPAVGAVPGLNVRAEGEYGAWQFTAWTEGGYDWRVNDWLITPHLSLKYSNLNVHSLQEMGAGAFNLQVNYDDVEEFVLGGGVRLGYLTQLDNEIVVHPHVYGQVFHDFINDRQQSTSRFVGGGTRFVTPGLQPDDTSFRAGVGVNFMCTDNWTLSLNYDFEFKDDYDSHGGFLKFRKEWA